MWETWIYIPSLPQLGKGFEPVSHTSQDSTLTNGIWDIHTISPVEAVTLCLKSHWSKDLELGTPTPR